MACRILRLVANGECRTRVMGIASFVAVVDLLVPIATVVAVVLIFQRKGGLAFCRSVNRLDGKTVLVTAASAGISRQTTADSARRDAGVVMACRKHGKGSTDSRSSL